METRESDDGLKIFSRKNSQPDPRIGKKEIAKCDFFNGNFVP